MPWKGTQVSKIAHLKITNLCVTTLRCIKSVLIILSQNRTKISVSHNTLSFTCFWKKNCGKQNPVTYPTKQMMDDGSIKSCLWWEVDYFCFGILVVIHDAWLKRSGFTVCVFSASFTSRLSTELCPEMSPEPLSGFHGPSVEAPTSVVAGKRGYGNWCTDLWRYCIAWGSLISKWLSKFRSKTRERTWGEATKPAWEPLMRCLLMKGERQVAKKTGQKEMLSQNCLGCYRSKG